MPRNGIDAMLENFPFAVRIIIPSVPDVDLSPNSRVHRMARHQKVKAARKEAKYCAIASKNGHMPIKADVWLKINVTWPKGRRKMDTDNLIATLKPVLDGVTDAGLWEDDCQVANLLVEQFSMSKPVLPYYPHGVTTIDVHAVKEDE